MAEPPAKRRRLDMTERFMVVVGKKAKVVPVITSIATRSSKFFQAAMEHNWKEAREKRVMLPDARPDVFEGYLQWLYTGQITFEFLDSIRFYVLGDYLDDLTFRHAVLADILARFFENGKMPGSPITKLAWDNTPLDSLLRQLILDMSSTKPFRYSVHWILGPPSQPMPLPQEFVHEHFERWMLANTLGRIRGTVYTNDQLADVFRLRMSAERVTDDEETGNEG